jgi:tetratricopeptide (TPR) repeat protein
MRIRLVAAILVSTLALPAQARAGAATNGAAAGVEIPGDGDVPLQDRLAREPLDRSLLTAQGFDYHSARAVALIEADHFAEAEALLREIVAAELAAPDRYDPYLAWAETVLGRAVWRQQRRDEAEQIFQRAFERVEPLSGQERTIYWVSANYGGLLASEGRFDEAEPLLRMAVNRWSGTRGKGSVFSLSAQIALAYALFAQGKEDELRRLLTSLEAQIVRYKYEGSDMEARLHRLQCLAAGLCRVDETSLRVEASEVITPRLRQGESMVKDSDASG